MPAAPLSLFRFFLLLVSSHRHREAFRSTAEWGAAAQIE